MSAIRRPRRTNNQQRLRDLAFVYADTVDVPVSALPSDQVVIDRTNRSWQELFAMARLFLQDRYQTTTGGASHGTAMLFEE
jgi:5-methylcytosine-specific restriction enzyme subunit McrC